MNYSELLKEVTPNGSQTLSKMRNRFPSNYPQTLSYGKGGHVYEAFEGRRYIDLISGLGCVSVGYGNDKVNDAIKAQLACGITFSLPNMREYEVAKRLTELVPGTEMWKFGKNGTDGTVYAVRAARAYTGRMNIVTVGYNGCADQFEIAGTRTAGIPQVLHTYVKKAHYNNLDSFSSLRYHDVACVLLEPMVLDEPNNDFLNRLRQLCNETGTVLIFDEVVTGGRFGKFTAQSMFNVQPDLTVLGKAIANGLPLCAVGGTRRIMSTFERNDFFASGTFGGETLSLAACLATTSILSEALPKMIWNGSRIKEAFNKIFAGKAECKGYPTRLHFTFPSCEHQALFMQEMCTNGVLTGSHNFIMADHTEKDVTEIIEAIFKSYEVLMAAWENPISQINGPLPDMGLRKN